jgi:hypothetical protein
MATALPPELALTVGGDTIAPPPPVVLEIPLCVLCNENPRAGSGRLTRCLPCIRAEAERDRQNRIAAEAALAARAKSEQPTKKCQTCRVEKALTEYFRHRLGKDGRRRSCIACVRSGKAKKAKPLTPEQLAADKARRAQPHRRAANLEAAVAWQARNPAAVRAARVLDADVRHGKITPATVCEAERCEATGRLSGHHNSYVRRKVAWLCAGCHRLCHSGVPIRLKETAAFRVARAPKTA